MAHTKAKTHFSDDWPMPEAAEDVKQSFGDQDSNIGWAEIT